MGYEYYQHFEIAKLLHGKTIDLVSYMDHEGEVGLAFTFTDGTDLWLNLDLEEEIMEVFLEVDRKAPMDRVHNELDITGYWGRRRGDWRKEDPGW